MTFDKSKLYAVIMAGGRGERFWPAGRQARPKQLLPLLGDKTMIEETVQRLFPLIAPERLLVITNLAYVDEMRQLLPLPPENIIGEPAGRDTAPCAALATALVRRRDADATMALLPVDHAVRPVKRFQETLLAAAMRAQSGALITFGITPSYAAAGYGYLHTGEPAGDGFYKVTEFKEKPDPAAAERYFQSGDYLWNSGMFVWRCDAAGAAFRKYAPALSEKMERWSAGADFTADFAECERISVDYAVMEKADNVLVCEANFYWNDIGGWSAMRAVLQRDAAGNAVRGNAAVVGSENNVLLNDDGGLLLGVVGMRDTAVIKSGNGILVCPLSEERKIRMLVEKLKAEHPEFL